MSLEGGGSIHHHLWRLKYTELNEIYATMTLRTLGCSLVAIFIPIFLLTLGYSFRDIFAVNLMMYSFEFIMEYPSAALIRRFGPKHVIALSIPFLILHFILIMTLPNFQWPLWTIGLTGGLTMAFFWQAYHWDFSKAKHRKKTSAEISGLYIAIALMAAIAPLLGGFIATRFSVYWTYALAIFILTLSIFPLFKTKEPLRAVRKFNLSRVSLKKIRFDIASYMGSGMEVTTAAVVWPLFIYAIVSSYAAVGLVTSLALVVTILVTYWVGKRADRKDRSKYIKFGGFTNGIVFLLQTLSYTIFHVFFFNIIRSFANAFSSAPYTSEYYLHADEQGRSEYMFVMESAVDLGRVILFLILFISTFYLADKAILILGLVLGAVGSFMVTLMPLAKCEICGPLGSTDIKIHPRLAKS